MSLLSKKQRRELAERAQPKQEIRVFSDFLFLNSIDDLAILKGRGTDFEIKNFRDEDQEDPGYYVEEICFQIIDSQKYELFDDVIAANVKSRQDRIDRLQNKIELEKMKKKLLRVAKCRWRIHIRSIFGRCLRSNDLMLNYARNYLMSAHMIREMYNYNLFLSGEVGIAFPIRLACFAISFVARLG